MSEVKQKSTIKKLISFKISKESLNQLMSSCSGIALHKSSATAKVFSSKYIHFFATRGKILFGSSIDVNLNANVPISGKFTVSLLGSSIKVSKSCLITPNKKICFPHFATFNQIQASLKNDVATVQCEAEIDIDLRPTFVLPQIFESIDRIPFDFKLVVGDKNIKVHKNFLALISPVLNASFNHDTVEAKTNEVVITDFEYETVNAVIDYFYGRSLKDTSTEKIIQMLRFMDKYDLKSSDLEALPFLNISDTTFTVIVQYAFDCCKDDLLSACAEYLSTTPKTVITAEGFEQHPVELLINLLKQAFSFESVLDVLRYTRANKYFAITKVLEPTLKISLETFCPIASYAWDFDIDTIQAECVNFIVVDENCLKLVRNKHFLELGGKALKILMTASRVI